MTVPIQTPLNSYTADGKTVVFPYKFYTTEYTDLVVEVNGVEQSKSNYTVTGMGGKNGGDVTFKTAPAAGAEVVIFRRTPVSRDSEFIDNGDLLAATVNREFDRIWLVQQEQKASNAATLARPTGGGAWDAQKYRIENVAPATLDTDAVTLGQVKQQNNNAFNSATAADGSAKAAAASAAAAATSAANAKTESDTAHLAAVNANTSQLLAQKAAQDAATDATSAAQTQLTTIINPAVAAAQTAQRTAQQNANTAGGYATDAQGYAQNASASATGAARSATAAAQSATDAEASAQAAAQSAATINTTAIMTAINKKLDLSTWQQAVPTLALKSDLTGLATSAQVQQAIDANKDFIKLSSSTMQTVNSPLYLTGYLTLGAGAALTTDAAAGTDIVNYRTMVDYVKNNVTVTGFVDDSTNQTVAGIKTFSTGLRVTYNPQNNTDVVPKSYVDNQIANIQIPSLAGLVDTSTEQDINGNKHFKGKLTVSSAPRASDEVVNLGYMGTLLGGMVSKTADVSIAGTKTFTGILRTTTAPNGDDDVVNQKALNDAVGSCLQLDGGTRQSVYNDVIFSGSVRVSTPHLITDPKDLVTKEYVDSNAGGSWMKAAPTGFLVLNTLFDDGVWVVHDNAIEFGSFGTPSGYETNGKLNIVEHMGQTLRLTDPEAGKIWTYELNNTSSDAGWRLVGGWQDYTTSASVHLDLLKSENKYFAKSIYVHQLPTDYDQGMEGILIEVIGGGDNVSQRITSLKNGAIYSREWQKSAGVWGAWRLYDPSTPKTVTSLDADKATPGSYIGTRSSFTNLPSVMPGSSSSILLLECFAVDSQVSSQRLTGLSDGGAFVRTGTILGWDNWTKV